MLDFRYYMPTKVIFGHFGAKEAIAEIVEGKYKSVLIHASDRVDKHFPGLVESLQIGLSKEGIDSCFLGGVVPNPRLSIAEKGIKMCKEKGIDFILAIGGGSAIDSAKCIGYGALVDHPVWDFYCGKSKPKGCLPVGVILTRAASGSETSDGSVITNEDGWLKRDCGSDYARPKFAIMNPVNTYSLSPFLTAIGVADILMHTMERYFTPTRNVDLIDGLCEAILRDVMRQGEILITDPQNYEARAAVMWAASICHNGLLSTGRKGDWATHKIEHAISGMFDVHHGAGVAALWSTWARYVYQNDVKRFVKFAVNAMGIIPDYFDDNETALRGILAMEDYFRKLGLGVTLKELGIELSLEQAEELANEITINGPVGNFTKLEKEDVVNILMNN